MVTRCWRIRLSASLAGILLCAAPVSAQMVAHTVSVTTDSSGDATAYTPSTFGRVRAIRYVPDDATPLDGGADITITDNTTGLAIVTITNIGAVARDMYPRTYTMDSNGITALYAAGGEPVNDLIPVAGPVKIVVASGGATKSGTLYVFVEGR